MKIEVKLINSKYAKEAHNLLKYNELKDCDGKYPYRKWIESLLLQSYKAGPTICLGAFYENRLIGVLISENLLYNGSLLWYISVQKIYRKKGVGTLLLKEYQNKLKKKGIEWSFLNATDNSLDFYNKNQFKAQKKTKVTEMLKFIK